MLTDSARFTVTWEKLPDDYRLPDDPVDNITQPNLAAALTESLANAGKLQARSITFTNYGICATVDGKIVVKAPDWGYVPEISVDLQEVERSYTPKLEGEIPAIVMEFLSATEGSEYSVKPTYPPGKWFFYEQVLRVRNYAIFNPETADLEVYRLDDLGKYSLQPLDENQRIWIPEMQLFLGVWQGTRNNRTGNWLRWWDEAGNILLWGDELAALERQRAEAERQRAEVERQRAEVEQQRAEAERQRAEAERQRADRLAEQLRSLGIDPDAS